MYMSHVIFFYNHSPSFSFPSSPYSFIEEIRSFILLTFLHFGVGCFLVCVCVCACAKLLQPCSSLQTPWTIAHQAPLSMGFSRQEHWSGLPCPPPGDLPNPGIEPTSLRLLHGRQILYCLNHQGSPSLHTNIKLFLYPLYCWQIDSLCRYFIRFLLNFFFFFGQNYFSGGAICSVAQLCPTLCESMDCSTPGFPVHH